MCALTRTRRLRRGASAAALTATLLWASAVSAVPRSFEIDPNHLFITFMVEHAGLAKIVGRFMRGQGRFVYDPSTRTIDSGTITVFSKSVFTGHYQRDKLLRSAPFLNVWSYPEIVFEVANFEPTGKRTGKLDGQLTMLGETRPVTFDVRINRVTRTDEEGPLVLGASARMTIARSRWGMRPGVAELADGVELIVEFEARQVN